MLDGGILLARLPKGALGEETARLLGSFIVAGTWQAAAARARTPEHTRIDATLSIDEAHNFLTLPYPLEDMLAEARGYRLSMLLAHQHLAQLPRDLREGISPTPATRSSSTPPPKTPPPWNGTRSPPWPRTTSPTSAPTRPPPTC
ncbi:hypothetical protein ACFWZY_28750 [Streptomyces sp. NPDC058992]|uniref:hypothetical protein n=1 Tax=Streptomyces sp. NPDC058992 TaxID=3346688 RepID=UPI0036A5A210